MFLLSPGAALCVSVWLCVCVHIQRHCHACFWLVSIHDMQENGAFASIRHLCYRGLKGWCRRMEECKRKSMWSARVGWDDCDFACVCARESFGGLLYFMTCFQKGLFWQDSCLFGQAVWNLFIISYYDMTT